MKSPRTEEEAVKQFTPFVHKTAKSFLREGVEHDDLVQVGLLAVVRAYRKWRSDGGANMLTWIRQPVRNAMTRIVHEQRRAGGTGTGEKRKVNPTKGVKFVSMDEEIGTLGAGHDKHYTLHDILAAPAPSEESTDSLMLGQLPNAVAALPFRERQVIRLRFAKGMTLQAIGDLLGLSRERIRQIERDALQRLRRTVKPDAGLPS